MNNKSKQSPFVFSFVKLNKPKEDKAKRKVQGIRIHRVLNPNFHRQNNHLKYHQNPNYPNPILLIDG